MNLSTRVLRFRLKDKHAKLLRELAREVNLVWNFCNELSLKVWQREQRFLSGYDFHPFTKGAGKAGLGLHSQTLQAIGEEYAVRRKQARKRNCAGVCRAGPVARWAGSRSRPVPSATGMGR
ncbi:hypothetical protein [Paraburkholderia pallida]|uniref:Transposase n=1 Tax=Paraburkholderia pallida TaxID=2547399 RepID=A0A4P7D939_9BURK|nr:hypothetical protein [Paraburkholderia pallida]QBR03720.1 hypothetical protein E1956_42250 [Paraburkholderia pallida]